MATVSQNIATIINQAEILDDLVSQFRSAAAIIIAAETEIRKSHPGANSEAVGGRIRLAYYAHALMVEPSIAGRQSVAALASSAWSGVS